MTDAEILAEGALVGRWLEASDDKQVRKPVRSVAVIGGLKFDEQALDSWLLSLRAKYPGIVVRTGTAKGAETFVASRACELGLSVYTPERNEFLGPDCEVTEALIGADAICVVGPETGKRASLAIGIHKRCDQPRKHGRPLVKIAAPPKTAKAPRRKPVASVVRD